MEAALRRIVLQLSAQSPHPYRALEKHYNLSKGQTLPSYQELLLVLKEVLQELRHTYLVLDALDECQETELGQLMDMVSTLRSWTHAPLHLLITSQPRISFTDSFKDMPCVFLESEVTLNDIKLFVSSELRDNHKMKTWASRAEEIIDRIVLKSSGMSVPFFECSYLTVSLEPSGSASLLACLLNFLAVNGKMNWNQLFKTFQMICLESMTVSFRQSVQRILST